MPIARLAKNAAFELKKRVQKLPRARYGQVWPAATYSPWNVDAEFRRTYDRIQDHTLVDQYRCYELWTLVREAKKVPGALLEVGAWRGGTAAIICTAARSCGISDPFYVCDTFTGVVKTGARDSVYKGGEHSDTSKEAVRKLLDDLGCEGATLLKGVFPEETGKTVTADRFRFCHIDVDVYDSAKDATEFLWPKLSRGGVIVYDDYGFDGTDGVTTWVDEQRALADRVVIHNLNGHGIVIKTAEC